VIMKEIGFEILKDLQVLSTPIAMKLFLECRLSDSVFKYVWMCASLAPQRLDKFYSYSILNSLSIIGRCSANVNILAPKIGILEIGFKTK
jgi:hypothetical protein